MRNKCNTIINKYTVIHTIRFSVQQAESLEKLKEYDVNISLFNHPKGIKKTYDKKQSYENRHS